MIFKYPDFISNYYNQILKIISHLMSAEIRMEQVSLQIGSAIFEKIGVPSQQFLTEYFRSIFTSMHFYRNNTKSKQIPLPILKSILVFFANFMVYQGNELLMTSCDTIQKGIFFMILKSQGERLKLVTGPFRDRKYTIIAYSRLLN